MIICRARILQAVALPAVTYKWQTQRAPEAVGASEKTRRWQARRQQTSIIHLMPREEKEEFLIQFVKGEEEEGKRRQAELCVRQWKHWGWLN